ncbi:MAG: DUF1566 domain-containing protein [Bdellovibrionales bacterium]|nr:DUF1566 domain-containing protein [Bdellovibrionales bacterium]
MNTGTLTPGGTAYSGVVWYNSTSNQLKYWNGSAVQTFGLSDPQLADVAGIDPSATTGYLLGSNGTNLVMRSPANARSDLGLGSAALLSEDSNNTFGNGQLVAFDSATMVCAAGQYLTIQGPGPTYSYICVADSTTDATKLPLAGGTLTGALLSTSGSAATPGLSFAGDADTGFFSPGADLVAIATGGTERMRIDSSGYVGIGTTTPASALDVGNGEINAFRYTANGPGLNNTFFTGKAMGNSVLQLGSASGGVGGTVQLYDDTGASLNTRIVGSGNSYFNGGNVGIGTTAPAAALEVNGNILLSKGADRSLGVSTQANNTAGNNLSIYAGNAGAAAGPPIGGAGGSLRLSGGNSTAGGTKGGNVLLFGGSDSSGVDYGDVILAHDGTASRGNVGIGTSPSRLLHVNGPMRVTASALPGTPGAGDIAVDSGDSNNLKWYDGSRWLSVLGFGGEVNVSSTPHTITSSDNGKVFNYTNNAAGVINLPALSSVNAGFSVVITREVAKTLTITPNGSDKFPGGVATIEMQGKNLQSVTIMKAGSTWKLANQTEECTVGQDCWTADGTGGMKQLYVGTYKGKQYFTTPGGCTDSGTPTCAGGTDTVLKKWANNSGTTAYNIDAIATDDYEVGVSQSATLAGSYTDTEAAKFCENMNYAGYTDWYLPSKEELAFLHRNSASIGGFVYSSSYWSSTEYTNTIAWNFNFNVGYAVYNVKTGNYYVRCVRRF